MATKVAAGVWFLFALVMLGGLLAELSDPRPSVLFLAVTLLVVSSWLGYRLLQRPTRTIAIIAACVGAFFAVFFVMAILQDSLTPFPQGFVALTLAALAGLLPLRARRGTADAQE